MGLQFITVQMAGKYLWTETLLQEAPELVGKDIVKADATHDSDCEPLLWKQLLLDEWEKQRVHHSSKLVLWG
jgi:hypothetical protein